MSQLFVFNPTNEMAIDDGGKGYIPPRYLAQFESDLDTLPFVFAGIDDFVMVTKQPDTAWLDSLSMLRNSQPCFIDKQTTIERLTSGAISIDKLSPWGWSPRMIKILDDIVKLSPSIEASTPNLHWSSSHKKIYGRATSLEVLNIVVDNFHKPKLLISGNMFPIRVGSMCDVEKQFDRYSHLVIKTPYSSSGRGILMLKKSQLNRSIIDWIAGAIRRCGYVMVEPYLDVVNHFSMQFDVSERRCNFVAIGAFSTNLSGGYLSNFVGGIEVTRQVKRFMSDIDLKHLSNILSSAIIKVGIDIYYRGYIGVDMLLCRSGEGRLFLHPCCEINIRQNMGLVSHFLSRLLLPETVGHLRILKSFDFVGSSHIDYLSYNSPVWNGGLLRRGVMALTPPSGRNHIAVLEVSYELGKSDILWFNQLV